jgi:hypothetical protein
MGAPENLAVHTASTDAEMVSSQADLGSGFTGNVVWGC